MQTHLHLALTLGGSPEYAPVFKWKSSFSDFSEEPAIITSIKRTSKGKLRFHAIENSDGPIQWMNYHTTLKLLDGATTARQQLEVVKAMNGKTVYFVHPDHSVDGTDHRSYIKKMKLQITGAKAITPNLSYYLVNVELIDDNAVV